MKRIPLRPIGTPRGPRIASVASQAMPFQPLAQPTSTVFANSLAPTAGGDGRAW